MGKILISFFTGAALCGMMLAGINAMISPNSAEGEQESSGENLSDDLASLVPNIEAIYQEALTLPFEKVKSKIYDEDIAQFYQELMDATGLDESGGG